MDNNIESRIRELEDELRKIPNGHIVYKTIKGKKQPYLQWHENGKTVSKYIKENERSELLLLFEKKKELQNELKELKSSMVTYSRYFRAMPQDFSYRTTIITGYGLWAMINSVSGFKKRDCYDILYKFINSDVPGKVCLLYGLRRTGKTTMLLQACSELKDISKAAYIKIRPNNDMADINHDLKILFNEGYRYVFIDEVTLLSDFINSASMFSDIYGMMNMKIILSGTDSLGFWFTLDEELYDRAVTIHTTFIPLREYNRLLNINDVDEYISYGGMLKMGEPAFGDKDIMTDDASFRDEESSRRYIDSAICKNIQHSLAHYGNGEHFTNLYDLYKANELTSAINRIIEDMNHRFLMSVLTDDFVSHDLGSAAEVLRKDPRPEHHSDALDEIDRKPVTAKLMDILEIKNRENLTVGLNEMHIAEIKEYLRALDLISDVKRKYLPGNNKNDYTVFTQPGMRYAQAQALVYALMQDSAFSEIKPEEKSMICNRILEEVRGRMLEDIILFETCKILPKEKQAFKLIFPRGEYDMVITDNKSFTCSIYEIKHSLEIHERQYSGLIDSEKNEMTEKYYGRITDRIVIYRGPSRNPGNGICYINAEEYLKFSNT